jgi:hypothetical protein
MPEVVGVIHALIDRLVGAGLMHETDAAELHAKLDPEQPEAGTIDPADSPAAAPTVPDGPAGA